MTTRTLKLEEWEALRAAGAVKVAILRSDTAGHLGEPISCAYFNAEGLEIAHYSHDLYDFTGLIHYRRSWGNLPPEDRGYEVQAVDYPRYGLPS